MSLQRVAVVVGVALVAAGAAGPGAARQRTEPGSILFSRGGDEDDECGTIWSVDPEGGDPRQLDVGPGENCDPDWSPDGKHIAFSSNRSGTRLRIYVADSSGRNPVAITQPAAGDDFIPAWSPDGTRIVFERRAPTRDSFNLFIVDADGTHERQLTHGHGFDGTPW